MHDLIRRPHVVGSLAEVYMYIVHVHQTPRDPGQIPTGCMCCRHVLAASDTDRVKGIQISGQLRPESMTVDSRVGDKTVSKTMTSFVLGPVRL